MPSLSSLASELIVKIADQLETRKEFRATCKQIDDLVSPQLFSYIVIDINAERANPVMSQLEALASRSTRACEYVQTVEIRSQYKPDYMRYFQTSPQHPKQNSEADQAYEKMRGLLPAALSALVGARSVICTLPCDAPPALRSFQTDDPSLEWVSTAVSEYLAALHSLQALHLTMESGMGMPGPRRPRPSLIQISNLTELTVHGYHGDIVTEIVGNSPGLTRLDLECLGAMHGVGVMPTLHGVFKKVPRDHPLQLQHLRIRGYCIRLDHETLPHLRLLRSLEFSAVPPISDSWRSQYGRGTVEVSDNFASSITDTWEVIGREELPLEDIVSPINDAVLNYLSAVHGIRKLHITKVLTGVDESDFDLFGHGTIPTEEGNKALAHGFFTHVLPQHSKTLVSLQLPMDFGGPWFIWPHNASVLLECTQLAVLAIPVNTRDPSGAKKANLDDVVEEIFGLAAQLPNLNQLELFAGNTESWSNSTTKKLSKAILSFGPVNLDTHPQIVAAMADVFHAQRGSDGVARYMHLFTLPIGEDPSM